MLMIKAIMAASIGLMLVGTAAARAGGVEVFQEGKKFSEAEVSIKRGESVTFTNKDPVTHNVFSSTPGMAFDLRTQQPGESSTVTFDHAGEAEVHCAIHPQMKMKVKVTD
jgi:plastocyanin